MDEARAPMLFCPPLPPQRLEPDRPTTIGRHASCQLVIRRSDVSRRHAEVRPHDGRFTLHDLGSTNGSFVNGERIEGPRALAPGDRIEIGSTTITFCEVEGELADPEGDDSKTLIAAPLPTCDALRGDLAEIPPDALLQLLEMGSKSGVLEIRDEQGDSRIWFSSGAPIDARTEKLGGMEAALSIVMTRRGRFRFQPEWVTREPTIRASVTELLLEAARQRDEQGER